MILASGTTSREAERRLIQCIVPSIYPDNSLTFTIYNDNDEVHSSSDVTYTSSVVDGSFFATFTFTYILTLERAVYNLQCMAQYTYYGNYSARSDILQLVSGRK